MKSALMVIVCLLTFKAGAYDVDEALKVINNLKTNTITHQKYTNGYYSLKTGKKQALIIVTGVAEPVLKYWQLVGEFSDKYDIYLWDHINQGQSMKIDTSIDHRKVFIDSFSTYEVTFNNFLAQLKPGYDKINVISHSMGSHVMLRQLLNEPSSIDKLVMITPMIDVRKYFIPTWLAKFVLKAFYKPTSWAPSQGPVNSDVKYLTNSEENFANYMSLVQDHFPDQLSTGVTAGWLSQSISAVKYVLKSDFSKVKIPMQIFGAGDDAVVKTKASRKFCEKLNNCEYMSYENGKHQLLIEVDEVRLDVYKRMKEFFDGK